MTTMKAAIVEKPGVLAVREVPRPEPAEYQALCELLYGATCTGTDQHLIAGQFPWPPKYPAILGHESIGRVVALGGRVRHLKVGDLVTRVGAPALPQAGLDVCWGGFAEFGLATDFRAMQDDGLPAERWGGARVNQVIPARFDPAAATMVITWRETLSYFTRLGVGAGQSVLVVGSGGNGLAFVAHAANTGAVPVAMVGNADRLHVARAAGATFAFDYKAEDLDRQIAAAMPDGFDFIIDAVGKKGLLDRALPWLRSGGTVGLYGMDDFGQCLVNPTRARGSFTFSNKGYDEAETHDRVVDLVAHGKLDAALWLDLAHPFPLAEIAKAFDAVRTKKMVKAVVKLHVS
jgi:2-desacetyl-2-hydroxyethyl bacteriochlorophyllide A dehydrogenase